MMYQESIPESYLSWYELKIKSYLEKTIIMDITWILSAVCTLLFVYHNKPSLLPLKYMFRFLSDMLLSNFENTSILVLAPSHDNFKTPWCAWRNLWTFFLWLHWLSWVPISALLWTSQNKSYWLRFLLLVVTFILFFQTIGQLEHLPYW